MPHLGVLVVGHHHLDGSSILFLQNFFAYSRQESSSRFLRYGHLPWIANVHHETSSDQVLVVFEMFGDESHDPHRFTRRRIHERDPPPFPYDDSHASFDERFLAGAAGVGPA